MSCGDIVILHDRGYGFGVICLNGTTYDITCDISSVDQSVQQAEKIAKLVSSLLIAYAESKKVAIGTLNLSELTIYKSGEDSLRVEEEGVTTTFDKDALLPDAAQNFLSQEFNASPWFLMPTVIAAFNRINFILQQKNGLLSHDESHK